MDLARAVEDDNRNTLFPLREQEEREAAKENDMYSII
jgi:hypothetical protein